MTGEALLRAVAVMDRLRSPGGCPWDAQQTHASLVPYLVEEAHEAVEALESGDREHMREELGDVLLQVLFHSRVAQEDLTAPFDIDDVAQGLVDKLVRRHPHVFADATAADAAAVEASWEQLKAAEKPSRRSVLDGIPRGMPPLERAVKIASRLERSGHDLAQVAAGLPVSEDAEQQVGRELLDVVVRARAAGVDPAAALRAVLRSLEAQVEVAGDQVRPAAVTDPS